MCPSSKGYIILPNSLFRHLETAFIDVDVQPKYVRIVTKGKVRYAIKQEQVQREVRIPLHCHFLMYKTHKINDS